MPDGKVKPPPLEGKRKGARDPNAVGQKKR